MASTDSVKRCAHAACTCHVQGDGEYCSESCASNGGGSMHHEKDACECGHAACVASEYAYAQPPAMASSR